MIYLLRILGQENRSQEDLKRLKRNLVSFAVKRESSLSYWKEEATPTGAPILSEHPELHLSITHTQGLIGCAIAPCPVGLDAEKMRGRDAYVARKILGEEEFLQYEVSTDKDQTLLRYFTLKEAYGKALGKGLSYDFKRTNFSFTSSIICSDIQDAEFYFPFICEDFIISVCYLGGQNSQKETWTVPFIVP